MSRESYHITDNGDLNKIYRAAKLVTIQPDKFNLEKLARAIWVAENREAPKCSG
jgi:hypothetical protein